jgi:hypothetical protein
VLPLPSYLRPHVFNRIVQWGAKVIAENELAL